MSDPAGVVFGIVIGYVVIGAITAWTLGVNDKVAKSHLDAPGLAASIWWPVVVLWFVLIESPRLLWRLRSKT